MSLRRYPLYRDSGVALLGNVPTHWRTLKLKHAADVMPSNVDKKSYDGEQPVRLCNYTDVYYNDVITPALDFMAATASDEQVARFTLRDDDVIVTKDSETAGDIAIAAHVRQALPGVVCGYHLALLRPRVGFSGAFIKRLFDSAYVKAAVAVRANGLTRVGLSQYALDSLELAFPSLTEQETITEFLGDQTAKLDALVAEQRRLIALLREKRQSVVSHAVTRGLDTHAQTESARAASRDVMRIKHVIRSVEQGWSPQCEAIPVENSDEWGVLKVGCVNGGTFNPAENKKLPEALEPLPELGLAAGDVLISRANTRDLVGSAAVVPSAYPRLMLCDKLYRMRIKPGVCEPDFLSAFLQAPVARSWIEAAATGASASMVNIAQSTILELPIALPTVEEQRAILATIAARTQTLDVLTCEAERAITLLLERRAALISAAVTGQIDVRNLTAQRSKAPGLTKLTPAA